MLRAVALAATLSFAQSAHTITATVVAPFISVSAVEVQQNIRSLTDTVNLTDGLVLEVTVALSDSVTLSDAIALVATVALADGVSLADSLELIAENAAISGHMLNERILNG